MRSVDCGIVIALSEEFDAKRPGVPGFHDTFRTMGHGEVIGGKVFIPFSFSGVHGDARNGVVAILNDMGSTAALHHTHTMISEFDPKLMVNVGISGALSSTLKLGDLVVAKFSDQYDHRGKVTGEGLRFGGQPFSSYFPFYNAVQNINLTNPEEYWFWQKLCSHLLGRAISPTEQEALVREQLISPLPTLLGGPIACGNSVIAGEAFRDALLDHNRTFMAVDMESAGFLQACHEQPVDRPRIVLRAISDFADPRKDKLDAIGAGGIRAWAIAVAYQMLDLLLTKVIVIPPLRSPTVTVAVRTIDDDRYNELAKTLHTTITDKYLKKRYRKILINDAEDISIYDALFHHITSSPGAENETTFPQISAAIVASESGYPLCVNGRPGTGKSSFLNVLYLWLKFLNGQDSSSPLPIYVNLKAYYGFPFDNGRPEALKQFMEDTRPFRQLLQEFPEQNTVVLIDGVDEYMKASDTVEDTLVSFVHEYEHRAKKVVGVGLNYIALKDRFRRDLFHLREPERVVLLGGIASDSSAAAAFCSAAVTLATGVANDKLGQEVVERARHLSISTLDLFTVGLLLDHIASASYKALHTIGDWYNIYCREVLARHGERADLRAAAKLAFDYAIQPIAISQEQLIGKRLWKLLHRHRSIKDFLVAYHVIDTIKEAGKAGDVGINDLDYVYPNRIATFAKELANTDSETQRQVLTGIKRVYSIAGPNSKPHLCYLAGRLKSEFARAQARDFLKTCQNDVRARIAKGEELSTADLLLVRTIYISLAYLGDRDASEEYLKHMMRDERWDDLNRGFHLEYYGDIDFDPEAQMSHRDSMERPNEIAPCRNTMAALLARIERYYEDGRYGLLDIEVFTLFSLAQQRHAAGVLPESDTKELRNYAEKLLTSRSKITKTLRPYLAMLVDNFERPSYPPMTVIDWAYRLKTELRQGWLIRNVDVPRVESVAEHTCMCCMFALMYLPDRHPDWPAYDKAEVLKTLLIHDIAEAEIGDIPLNRRDERSRELERAVMRNLQMLSTYIGVVDLTDVYVLWEAFENGRTESARIAADIDKLENLIQLYRYEGGTSVEGSAEWKQWIEEHLQTKAGHHLLKLVRDLYERKRIKIISVPATPES